MKNKKSHEKYQQLDIWGSVGPHFWFVLPEPLDYGVGLGWGSICTQNAGIANDEIDGTKFRFLLIPKNREKMQIV